MNHKYIFSVHADGEAASNRGAAALIDFLRETDGVSEASRGKTDATTMDVGTIVSVLATSGATLSIAQGIAAWLRARRGVTLKVTRQNGSNSLVTEISGIDPDSAKQIIERVS